jgi:putative ABC transport system ATP-binding protein
MKPAIQAVGVCKGFGSGQRQAAILRSVSLEIGRGETVFFVGPSGSGKTTLLSILGCILGPDSGSVKVLDHEVTEMKLHQLTAFRRDYLGFIFQSFNLFPTLSALDNIRLALTMRGTDFKEASTRAEELLNHVGLWHRQHLRPGKLSTGECQRIAVARGLAVNPAILFADEPTASLDATNGRSIMKLLTRLVHERGVTLVVVTHDSRIYPFADRILRLEDGSLTNEWARPAEAHQGTQSQIELPDFLTEQVA